MHRTSRLCFIVTALGLLSGIQAQTFHQSYAIVIGIQVYDSPDVPRLANPRRDAESIAALLKSQGYTVSELYDRSATRGAILDALDAIAQRATEDDRVLFFFAGHGTTLPRGGKDWGYIIPYDGRPQQSSTLIGMDQLQTESAQLGNARHQLFLMDSCYGGAIGDRGFSGISPTLPNYIAEITRRVAREALTAGGKNQTVEDGAHGHSIFTQALLEAIQEGKADVDGDGFVTFPELVAYILPRASTPRQTPLQVRLPGHGQGEYWFVAPNGQPAVTHAVIAPPLETRAPTSPITTAMPPAAPEGVPPRRFALEGVPGFRPIAYRKTRDKSPQDILDVGVNDVDVNAKNGAIALSYDGQIIGNLSCKGLSVDSSGARVIDSARAQRPGVDYVTIHSDSGSFSYYSKKKSGDDRKAIRQGLIDLCRN